jgi:hypothetical protein
MVKRGRQPRPPQPPPPKPPSLDGIALHDAKLLCKIILGAMLVELLFKVLYIPIVGPPRWLAEAIEAILSFIILVLTAAAAVDVLLSIYFHFRNRVRTKI